MSEHGLAAEFATKSIDAIFKEVDQGHLPGAAVGIAIEGKPVYRKGFGLASIELPITLSPTMRMRIGSTTKHFAALAYMLLCEEGKAGVDESIGKWMPELHPVTQGVTPRQLMANTSGLRDAIQISWDFSGTGRQVSTAELLSLYRDIDDVNAAPDTAWIYINGGWLLLSVLIERITGQSLEEVLYKRIFEPVGMYDTLLRRWDTDFIPNSATLHMLSPAGGYEKAYLGTALTGEGGVVSTIDDMLRWLAHMDQPRVGSAATWSAMKTPQVLANGASTGYGFGLMTGQYRGVEILHHGGSVMGGVTQMLKVPAAGLDVVVISNRWDGKSVQFANQILDSCLPDLEPHKQSRSGALVRGVFQSPTTGRVIQLRPGDSSPYHHIEEGQQIASIDGLDVAVESDLDSSLRPAMGLEWMKQTIKLLGDPLSPDSIQLNDFGNLDKFKVVKSVEDANVDKIAGLYRSKATSTDAVIYKTDTGPQLRVNGRFGSMHYALERLAYHIWRAKPRSEFPPGFVLSLDADCTGLRIFGYRTFALSFERIPDFQESSKA
jgi:D-aminopeptidase